MEVAVVLYQFQAEYASVSRAATAVTSSFKAIENAFKQQSGAAQKGKESHENFVGSLVSGIGKVSQWTFFVKAMGQTVMGFTQSLFAQNAAMEQTRTSFVGVFGSAAKADEMLQKLQNFAAATPFEFPELAKDAQMLLAVGVSARDVIPYMTAIGDATSKMGQDAYGVQRVTLAITQMIAKGKVGGDDMRQLTEAQIPSWTILAQAMHKTTGEVMDLSQKGKLGADAVKLLVSGMEQFGKGAMVAQSRTMNGLMSTLHDNVGMAWRAFAGPAFDMAKNALTTITDQTSKPQLVEWAKQMGVKVGQGLTAVVQWIQQAIKWVQNLWSELNKNGSIKTFIDILGTLRDIGLQVVNGVLLLFVRNTADAGKAASGAGASYKTVAANIKTFGDQVSTVLGWMKNLTTLFADSGIKGELFRGALTGIVIAMAAFKVGSFIAMIIPMIPLFITLAGAIWVSTVAFLASPVTWIAVGIALVIVGLVLLIRNWDAVVKWVRSAWGTTVAWVGNLFSQLGAWTHGWASDFWNTVVTAFTSVKTWIITTWNSIMAFFGSIFSAIGSFFHNLWQGVLTTTINIWNGIYSFFGSIFSSIGTFIHDRAVEWYNNTIGPFVPMLTWFRDLFVALFQILLKIIGLIVAGIIDYWNRLASGWHNIWTGLSTWFMSWWTVLSKTVAQVVGIVVTIVVDYWNRLASGWHNIWSAVSNWFVSWWSALYTMVADFVGRVVGWIQNRWNLLMTWIRVLWAMVSKIIGDAWNLIYSIVSSRITDTWNQTVKIFNNIKTGIQTVWNQISKFIGDAVTSIKKVVGDVFSALGTSVSSIWKGIINGMIDKINQGIGAVRGFLNGIADAVNNVEGALGVDKKYRMNHVDGWLKNINPLARGTGYFGGGLALVGEEGPELLGLPRGAAVLPAQQTRNFLAGGGIPGFAGGVGDMLSNMWSWISGGVGAIGSHIMGMVNAPSLGGNLAGIGPALVGKLGGWVGGFINGLMPKIMAGVGNLAGPMFGNTGLGQLVTQFGARMWYGMHEGLDLARSQGSRLYEFIGGKVYQAGWHDWGGEVDVALSNGLLERYLHLSAIAVRAGQNVSRGQFLGLTGGGTPASGLGYWSTGPHLHYQVDPYNINAGVNPWAVLAQYGIKFANGGIINEPIAGIGLRSGRGYSFGERGPETVTPGTGGHVTIINIDGREFAKAVGPAMVSEIILQIGGAH